MNILFEKGQEFQLPRNYWHDEVLDAAAACSLEALRAILSHMGNSFVTEKDIVELGEGDYGKAIIMIVSQWDEVKIEQLLAVRKIEITDEVIRAAAGNLKSGAKIMELLLKKELEVED